MRLFVAVWPPPDVVEALAAVPRPKRPELRWTAPGQWHVTLRFFGEVDIDEGVAAGEGVAEVAAGASVTPVELGPAVAALGHRVLQVPVTGLGQVAGALATRTATIGVAPAARPFSGHVTLARVRRRGSLDGLTGTPVGGRWEVRELSLVASTSSGRHGVPNRYEVVASFPFAGEGA